MSALNANSPVFKGSVRKIDFDRRPLAAGVTTYQGGLAVANPGGTNPGYYGEATGALGEVVVGRWYGVYGAAVNAGAAGSVTAGIQFFRERYLVLMNNDPNGATALTTANREQMVSVLDDNHVTLDNGRGLADAGIFYDFSEDGSGQVWIEIPYPSSAQDQGPAPPSLSTANKVRGVITALPGTYTGSGLGTFTAAANGALAAQQGVTPEAGDVFWLEEGAANIVAAKDGGPVQVVQPGTAGTPYILTRVSWWMTGNVIPVGADVTVGGEDTLFGGSKVHTYAAKGAVVDTTAPSGFPDKVKLQVTLVNGSFTISTVPLRAGAVVVPQYAGSGTPAATTLTYEPAAVTPGHLGTASVVVSSVKAQMVVVTGDTSVLNVAILQ